MHTRLSTTLLMLTGVMDVVDNMARHYGWVFQDYVFLVFQAVAAGCKLCPNH